MAVWPLKCWPLPAWRLNWVILFSALAREPSIRSIFSLRLLFSISFFCSCCPRFWTPVNLDAILCLSVTITNNVCRSRPFSAFRASQSTSPAISKWIQNDSKFSSWCSQRIQCSLVGSVESNQDYCHALKQLLLNGLVFRNTGKFPEKPLTISNWNNPYRGLLLCKCIVTSVHARAYFIHSLTYTLFVLVPETKFL